MNLRFRKYSWQLAPGTIRNIRQTVFIDEQRVPPELEWDDTDEIADHYLAVLPDNTPVGTARLFSTLDETAHIGRMAILPEFRGQGVGEHLLRHLVSEAASQFSEILLSAQKHAIPFYRKTGFHVCSDAYDDAGIPHYDMRCLAPQLLAQDQWRRQQPMILAEDDKPWSFSGESAMTSLTDSLVSQAGQRLWLYERWLDHDLYDRHRFRELVSAIARKHPQAEVRLLIHDDRPLVERRHRIVELMRRLPSRIQLRLVNPHYPVTDRPFMLVDREGVLHRPAFDRPEGFAHFSDSGRVRILAEDFQRMWEAGKPSLELRELPL